MTTPPPDRARLLLGPARATVAAGWLDPYAGRGGPQRGAPLRGARSGAVRRLLSPPSSTTRSPRCCLRDCNARVIVESSTASGQLEVEFHTESVPAQRTT